MQQRPNYLPALREAAVSHALSGRLPEARQEIARLRLADPAARISNLADRIPFRRAEDLAKFEDGLRKAGLPE